MDSKHTQPNKDVPEHESESNMLLFKRLSELRREAYDLSPDSFNKVAECLYGMSVSEAQTLYTKYRRILAGAWYWNETGEREAVAIFTKATEIAERTMKIRSSVNLRSIESFLGYENDRNRIGVWTRRSGGEPRLHELHVNWPEDLAIISEMDKDPETRILCIVRWVDSIYRPDTLGCMDWDSQNSTLHVYDGDIFVLTNEKEDNFWNRPSENGLYVCLDGCYRRLLYTVGRGYVDIDRAPNVASTADQEDAYGNVFRFGDGRFNHHIMTMNHKWRRVGNIHADVRLLIEPQNNG